MNDDKINKRIAKMLELSNAELDKRLKSFEDDLVKSYKQALIEIQSKIAKMYEKYGDSATYADFHEYNRLTNIQRSLADLVKNVTQKSIATTKEYLTTFVKESYYSTGFAVETTLNMGMGFGPLDENIIKASVMDTLSRIKWEDRFIAHSQKLVMDINQEITQGLIQGKGYAKVAKAITERTGVAASRSVLIARTESHRCQTVGHNLAFDQVDEAATEEGFSADKVWNATLDQKTRDDHAGADGQVADEEGLFHLSSGAVGEGPGLMGNAADDCNCRCTAGIQIRGFEPTMRKDNTTKTNISNMTYGEWKKGLEKK